MLRQIFATQAWGVGRRRERKAKLSLSLIKHHTTKTKQALN
jgi:hypothetical protein